MMKISGCQSLYTESLEEVDSWLSLDTWSGRALEMGGQLEASRCALEVRDNGRRKASVPCMG